MQEKKIYLPDSLKKFPDGANYRIEVSGMETPGILEAVIDEAKKLGIPIHRAISTVGGSMYWTDKDLKELAKIAAENKVEVIICPGNLAKGLIDNPNNLFTMMNWQNSEEAESYLNEILRCIKIGFRGFLVWRKGMLNTLNYMRWHPDPDETLIPPETIFKLSTFDNNANSDDFLLARRLGADTINAANNLTLENLFEIRSIVPTVLDIHITFWQLAFEKNEKGRLELVAKPYNRIADAPELARLCSPVYFKFEKGTPGISVYDFPRPDWTEKDLAEHKRKDVRTAAKIVEEIKKKYPRLKLSDWGPKDLRVPQVRK